MDVFMSLEACQYGLNLDTKAIFLEEECQLQS